jgi:hypothetical protein
MVSVQVKYWLMCLNPNHPIMTRRSLFQLLFACVVARPYYRPPIVGHFAISRKSVIILAPLILKNGEDLDAAFKAVLKSADDYVRVIDALGEFPVERYQLLLSEIEQYPRNNIM